MTTPIRSIVILMAIGTCLATTYLHVASTAEAAEENTFRLRCQGITTNKTASGESRSTWDMTYDFDLAAQKVIFTWLGSEGSVTATESVLNVSNGFTISRADGKATRLDKYPGGEAYASG